MIKQKTKRGVTIEMALHDVDGKKALSGAYHESLPADGVAILEKMDSGKFRLHLIETSEAEQSLRSFLTAGESLACETSQAVRRTLERVAPKPRRQRKATCSY